MSHKVKVGLLSISIVLLLYFTFFQNSDIEVIPVKIDDKDLKIQNRLFSPNKKFIVYSYVFDSGALDYTRVFHSIAESKDTLKQINQFEIPCKEFPQCYYPIKWKNDSTLIIETKLSDFQYYGFQIDSSKYVKKKEIFKWNGIRIIGYYYY